MIKIANNIKKFLIKQSQTRALPDFDARTRQLGGMGGPNTSPATGASGPRIPPIPQPRATTTRPAAPPAAPRPAAPPAAPKTPPQEPPSGFHPDSGYFGGRPPQSSSNNSLNPPGSGYFSSPGVMAAEATIPVTSPQSNSGYFNEQQREELNELIRQLEQGPDSGYWSEQQRGELAGFANQNPSGFNPNSGYFGGFNPNSRYFGGLFGDSLSRIALEHQNGSFGRQPSAPVGAFRNNYSAPPPPPPPPEPYIPAEEQFADPMNPNADLEPNRPGINRGRVPVTGNTDAVADRHQAAGRNRSHGALGITRN